MKKCRFFLVGSVLWFSALALLWPEKAHGTGWMEKCVEFLAGSGAKEGEESNPYRPSELPLVGFSESEPVLTQGGLAQLSQIVPFYDVSHRGRKKLVWRQEIWVSVWELPEHQLEMPPYDPKAEPEVELYTSHSDQYDPIHYKYSGKKLVRIPSQYYSERVRRMLEAVKELPLPRPKAHILSMFMPDEHGRLFAVIPEVYEVFEDESRNPMLRAWERISKKLQRRGRQHLFRFSFRRFVSPGKDPVGSDLIRMVKEAVFQELFENNRT